MGTKKPRPEFNVTLTLVSHSDPQCELMHWPRYPNFALDDEVDRAILGAREALYWQAGGGEERRIAVSHLPLGHRVEFLGGVPTEDAEYFAWVIGLRLGFTAMRTGEVGNEFEAKQFPPGAPSGQHMMFGFPSDIIQSVKTGIGAVG